MRSCGRRHEKRQLLSWVQWVRIMDWTGIKECTGYREQWLKEEGAVGGLLLVMH